MSTDLHTQLREYARLLDDQQRNLTVDEVLERSSTHEPVSTSKADRRGRLRPSRGVWIAAAAAVITLLFGLVAWLFRPDAPVDPLVTTQPDVPTTTEQADEPEAVLQPDTAAQQLLGNVSSGLALQSLAGDSPPQLAVLTPPLELNVIPLTPADLGPLAMDVSGEFVASQPLADFGGFGRSDGTIGLWAGPISGEQTLISDTASAVRFHNSQPGLIAYIDTAEAEPSLYTTDLTANSGPGEQIATVPDATGILEWTEAGTLVTTAPEQGPPTVVLIPDGGDPISIESNVIAMSDQGDLLNVANTERTQLNISHVDTPDETTLVDWDGGSVLWAEWLPQWNAFAILSTTPDGSTASLIDINGQNQAQTSLPPGATPTIVAWDQLLVFQAGLGENCCSLLPWNPETNQTGQIQTDTQLIPIGATPSG